MKWYWFWFWVWDIRNILAPIHKTNISSRWSRIPWKTHIHVEKDVTRWTLTKKKHPKIYATKKNQSTLISLIEIFLNHLIFERKILKKPTILKTSNPLHDSPTRHDSITEPCGGQPCHWRFPWGFLFFGGKKQNSPWILQIFPGKYGGGKYMEIWLPTGKEVFLGLNWFRTVCS